MILNCIGFAFDLPLATVTAGPWSQVQEFVTNKHAFCKRACCKHAFCKRAFYTHILHMYAQHVDIFDQAPAPSPKPQAPSPKHQALQVTHTLELLRGVELRRTLGGAVRSTQLRSNAQRAPRVTRVPAMCDPGVATMGRASSYHRVFLDGDVTTNQ